MRKRGVGVLLTAFVSLAMWANVSVYPTFESCGVYVSHPEQGECRLYFKKAKDKQWAEAYAPVYDPKVKEFRGSIVRLSENTDYQVRAEVMQNGKKVLDQVMPFRTWSSSVKIEKTIPLSKFKRNKDGYYIISDLEGSEDGWIRITSNEEIDVVDTRRAQAIEFKNCHHVILEGITLKGGWKHGILVSKDNYNIRIVNCDISKWGRLSEKTNEGGVLLDMNDDSKINNDAGVRIEGASNIVVERCYIHDPKGKTNPWKGVIQVGPYAGKEHPWTHPEGMNGIYVRQALGGVVLRYNDVIGSQLHRYNDPIETAQNGAIDGGFYKDADIYGNMIAMGQDDCIELDGGQCNVRFYNNRAEQTFCGISTAPNQMGPSYCFNNVVFHHGDSYGAVSASVKNGGGRTLSQGRTFMFNNTMISERSNHTGVGYGREEDRAGFTSTSRNNIFVSRAKIEEGKTGGLAIVDKFKNPNSDFNYDLIGNTTQPDGKGSLMAKDGSEKNGIFGLPTFTDMKHGVFTLQSSSLGIDQGEVLANVSAPFTGRAPDMGALELGGSSLIPIRPLNIEADKYMVNLSIGEEVTIYFKVGDIGKGSKIVVRKSDDMGWLQADLSNSEIKSDSTFTLQLKASKVDYRQIGVLIVRLENGLSVPISVSAL